MHTPLIHIAMHFIPLPHIHIVTTIDSNAYAIATILDAPVCKLPPFVWVDMPCENFCHANAFEYVPMRLLCCVDVRVYSILSISPAKACMHVYIYIYIYVIDIYSASRTSLSLPVIATLNSHYLRHLYANCRHLFELICPAKTVTTPMLLDTCSSWCVCSVAQTCTCIISSPYCLQKDARHVNIHILTCTSPCGIQLPISDTCI